MPVNISANNLQDPDFVDYVKDLLGRRKVAPELLELELTEGALARNPEIVLRRLQDLRSAGLGLALDDFGTGYSSMDYLRRLPVDELKVDKSFVERITASDNDRAIVELMVRIAHTFGLEVVAEGVETAATEAVLIDMGCNCAQGYLYAPAMPVDEFIEWWKGSPAAAGS